MRDNLHSHVMAWLKVLLPMAALALLSTLFLLSRRTDPVTDLPLSVPGIDDPTARQQVNAPAFSTTTRAGETILLTAASARPDPARDGVAYASDVRATVGLTDGGDIVLRADSAELNEPDDAANLSGSVVVTSSTGYTVTTETLHSALSQVHIESAGPVYGEGPVGKFDAGKMRIDPVGDTGDVQMLFTEGVKLVYDPRD